MTIARDRSPVVCVVNKTKLIACGGMDSYFDNLKSCEMFDLTNNSIDAQWTLITSMEIARSSASGTLLPDGNTLVVIGGTIFPGSGTSAS